MSNVEKAKDETPVLRCPKNMKLPGSVKTMAALSGKSKEDKKFFMRAMGIALHEQATKPRSTPRDSNKSE